jgi:hypothetical protein
MVDIRFLRPRLVANFAIGTDNLNSAPLSLVAYVLVESAH